MPRRAGDLACLAVGVPCEARPPAFAGVTGYTGKGWGPGFARDANGKARKITGTAWQKQKDKPPARAISNNNYAGNFADFLKAASETAVSLAALRKSAKLPA